VTVSSKTDTGEPWLAGAMAVTLHGLRTLIHPVTDLDAAKAWWTDYLGFPPYFDEPFYVGFEVAGYELGLLPSEEPEVGALTYWGVDDVQAAMEVAIAAGATEHAPATEVGDGIVTGTVTTPHSGVVGFIVNPNFRGA
jgi:catechol 2,3-dioxygenase-like lactoylglutathione lyase family enzyme